MIHLSPLLNLRQWLCNYVSTPALTNGDSASDEHHRSAVARELMGIPAEDTDRRRVLIQQ